LLPMSPVRTLFPFASSPTDQPARARDGLLSRASRTTRSCTEFLLRRLRTRLELLPPKLPVVGPLAPSRYKIQFTASGELRNKLERLQELTPSDLAAAIEAAVT